MDCFNYKGISIVYVPWPVGYTIGTEFKQSHDRIG